MTADTQARYTREDLVKLIAGLGHFLANECPGLRCDDEADRGTLAGKLAAWLLMDKTINLTPDQTIPKGVFHAGINIVNEAIGEHIIRLRLDRTREMADGDFMQLQNFLWVTVGWAIRNNPEVIRTLEAAGVKVEVDPPAQPSPAEM